MSAAYLFPLRLFTAQNFVSMKKITLFSVACIILILSVITLIISSSLNTDSVKPAQSIMEVKIEVLETGYPQLDEAVSNPNESYSREAAALIAIDLYSGIPQPKKQPTEAMLENYEDLWQLFSPEELAFESDDFLGQISESLSFYDQDWLFGLAKLEYAMQNIETSRMEKVMNLITANLSPQIDEYSKVYRVIFRTWGASEGHVAVDYAMSRLPENAVRLDAGLAAVRSWAESDVTSASAAISDLPEDTYGKDYMAYALPYTYIESAPEAAIEWARSLPTSLRKNTLQHSMIKWLNHDSKSAVEYVTEFAKTSVESDEDIQVLISETALHLSREDTQTALEWVERLPDEGNKKQSATAIIIDYWTDSTPEDASKWMLELEKGSATDPIVDSFAKSAAWIDPEGAADWATTITDENMRKNSLVTVLNTWSRLDVEEARDWAEQNGYGELL